MTCETCTREKARAQALMIDVENLQADLLAKNRELARIKGELTRQRESSPEHKSVLLVFDHWRNKTGHKQAKLGDKRAQVVRSRLRDGFTEDQLLKAVDGCARFPFVGDGGRRSEGRPDERYDDLELICRNEVQVEAFIRLADRQDKGKQERREKARQDLIEVYGRNYDNASEPRWNSGGIETLLGALGRVNSRVVTRAGGQYMAQCPAHEDRDPSLSIKEKADGRVLIFCWAGCKSLDVLHELGLEFADIGGQCGLSPEAARRQGMLNG